MTDRKGSVSDNSGGHGGPTLSQPHRRLSRVEHGHPAVPNLAMRRMSMYRRPSMAFSQRTDQSSTAIAPHAIQLQNTYRLEPKADERFSQGKVEKAVQSILESFLEGETYDPAKSGLMSQNLSEVIKSRVREMQFPRYKIVCSVVIGQVADQGLQCVSRSIWNAATDNYACASYRNGSLFAIAMVYGLYFE